MQASQTAPSALGHMGLGFTKVKVQPRIPFSRLSRTSFLVERTGLAERQLKMGHIAFFLAAGVNPHRLPLWAGDLGGLATLGLLDVKIRQVEFLAAK